jgi:hypothetical protein
MTRVGHLARRFAGSLRPGGPAPAVASWAEAQLSPGEHALWVRMSGPDRRHAAGVAREVERRLGDAATRPVLAAALLHDVGKVESGFGTFGRVGATLAAAALGRDRVGGWWERRGLRGRVGRYVRHPEIGAGLLRTAGADPLTAAWAAEHHLPPQRWTVPAELARVLHAVDDD